MLEINHMESHATKINTDIPWKPQYEENQQMLGLIQLQEKYSCTTVL